MAVLSRRENESILIGNDIIVTVVTVSRSAVELSVVCQARKIKAKPIFWLNFGETAIVDDNITISFLKYKRRMARLTISAPREVIILRQELLKRKKPSQSSTDSPVK